MFKLFNKLFNRMDSSEEYDMLDLLAWHSNQLSAKLSEAANEAEENRILTDYLKLADEEFKEINDFHDDLDWINVSEPLSLQSSLRGKVVVLDFFTYCCINCMHILPDLKRLEQVFSIEDGLVVVGVHSAKFDNEKDSENIISAVQRYDITHPVVNDAASTMWMDLRIKCWPTLLVLGPNGNPLFIFMGEGHYDTLEKYVSAAIEYYGNTNALRNHSLPISLSNDAAVPSHLKFPGKIVCSKVFAVGVDGEPEDNSDIPEIYAISDSGNHRVLLIDANGNVIEKIGGKTSGFADGDYVTARFNSPQGLTFFNSHLIYVADTENHAIRVIDLNAKRVDTVAGTGRQGADQVGGKIQAAQEISSPWDVATYRTRDMDMSFHIDGESIPEKNLVLIAMAGTHQIWAMFIDETIWWKFKKFPDGAVAAIAGNGHEENRNNSYPQNAAFAQPSGLALAPAHKELYIADSESSCVRKLALADGKVVGIAGGDRNPLNLFAFGDVDGVQLNAKFQHPLGVAYDAKEHTLYVADTYNHKIKKIDLSTNTVTSCDIKSIDGDVTKFNEPGGLCLSPNCDKLYVANTNNHTIEIVSLEDQTSETLKLQFTYNQVKRVVPSIQLNLANAVKIRAAGGEMRLTVHLQTADDAKFTDGAPQKWSCILPNSNWTAPATAGSIEKDELDSGDTAADGDVDGDTVIKQVVHKATIALNAPASDAAEGNETVTVTFKLSLCATNADVCYPKTFSLNIPVVHDTADSDELDNSTEIIRVTVAESKVEFT